MNRLRIKSFVSLFLAGMLFTTCTLDDPGSPVFQYPLTLQAEKDYSLIRLSWSEVKVTGFKEYILLQSSQEIPDSPTPVVSQLVTVAKRIDDADITSLLVSDIIFSPNTCYKLYASINDRFLQSANICIERDFELINGFFDRGTHLKETDELVLFDRVNQKFVAYNYAQGEIINTVSENGLAFPILDISRWNGTTNLFGFDQSPGRFRKYRYPEMTITAEKTFNGVLFAAKTLDQFVFAAVEESGKSFKVLNRSNLIELDSEDGLLGNRVLGVFPGNPIIVLDISDASIKRFSIDQQGKITYLDTKTPGILQPGLENTAGQGNELFITGRMGTILNREGDILGTLSNSVNSFVFITRLSEDEKKAAFVVSDNVSVRLEVSDISNLQSIQKLTSFNVPNANYSDLIVDGDIIYLVGVSFDSGTAQTFILKYPMP